MTRLEDLAQQLRVLRDAGAPDIHPVALAALIEVSAATIDILDALDMRRATRDPAISRRAAGGLTMDRLTPDVARLREIRDGLRMIETELPNAITPSDRRTLAVLDAFLVTPADREERYTRMTLDEVTTLLDDPGVDLVEAAAVETTDKTKSLFNITIRRRVLATPAAEPAAPPAGDSYPRGAVLTAEEHRSPAGQAFVSWVASWKRVEDLPSPAAYRWSGFAAGWNAAIATARPAAQAVTDEMRTAAIQSLCWAAGKHIYTAFRNDAGLEKAVADALTAALSARQEAKPTA